MGSDTGALWCVVPAAGRGARFGAALPKQYVPLAGRPLIVQTLQRLAALPGIRGFMLALAADDRYWETDVAPLLDAPAMHGKPVQVTIGGPERSASVLAALHALPEDVPASAFVLVHDAARPCVRSGDVMRLVAQAGNGDGGLLGAPLRETLKHADADGCSIATEPRESRWRAFTPQMFRRDALTQALVDARRDGVVVTDEAMAMERAGFRPLLVEGSEDNIKVTTPADLALAEFLLSSDKDAASCA